MADKGRVAENVGTRLGWQHCMPIQVESVANSDVRRFRQRNPSIPSSKLNLLFMMWSIIHSAVGDAHGELVDLDPVELVDVNC